MGGCGCKVGVVSGCGWVGVCDTHASMREGVGG